MHFGEKHDRENHELCAYCRRVGRVEQGHVQRIQAGRRRGPAAVFLLGSEGQGGQAGFTGAAVRKGIVCATRLTSAAAHGSPTRACALAHSDRQMAALALA